MRRRAGILLHPLSLPGTSGCGTLNSSVDSFLEFCKYHHQSIWQVLPLGPTGYGDSPYQSFSTHAGNPYLISIEELVNESLATEEEFKAAEIKTSAEAIDYENLYKIRLPIIEQIAAAFPKRASTELKKAHQVFCSEQSHWLDDYSLYMAVKEKLQKPWQEWPEDLRLREPKALELAKKNASHRIEVHKVIQWIFSYQWNKVRLKAKKAGVQILGDLPIFVAADSADAWANPELFLFNKYGKPQAVAGVPPDYFSADGQLWGNPLYRWSAHQRNGFSWWKNRLRSALRMYDMVRIDHFRGFAAFWRVPARAKTARNGVWQKGPGEKLFKALKKEFPSLPVVAEDLGDITPDVYALRDKFDFPGMKVLQFAFSNPENTFLPHNYGPNFIVYTGTHDNDTTAGWYDDKDFAGDQRFFRHYLGLDPETKAGEAVKQMVRLAMRSIAHTAIIPLQDVLALGGKARMNTPAKDSGNWSWRASDQQLQDHQDWFKEATWISNRAP